jgi:hypothetical protein
MDNEQDRKEVRGWRAGEPAGEELAAQVAAWAAASAAVVVRFGAPGDEHEPE